VTIVAAGLGGWLILLLMCAYAKARERRPSMSDWKVFYRDDHRRDTQSAHTSKEATIVQALHLERRQHCRIQIIEGQNGELIDRETFEREHLKSRPVF
jgi:hypothetical protein